MKFFSSNMQHLRKSRGLTQSEIHAGTGIERTTWSNYERGKSFPNLQLFNEIVNFFGVSADDLLNSDLSNVHLNSEEGVPEKGKNVHLNVHPSVHLNAKKGVNKGSLTADEKALETMEKLVETLQKVIDGQDKMIQLQANKIGELEEIKRRLESEIPQIGKPVEDKQREAG